METPEKRKKLSRDPTVAWKEIEDTQEFLEVPQVSSREAKWPQKEFTRIVCMSDTHGLHREIAVPKGDILIHGGDFTSTGEVGMVQDTMEYLKELAFPTTICIAGNHDMTLHPSYYQRSWRRFHKRQANTKDAQQAIDDLTLHANTADSKAKFHYLEDASREVSIGESRNGQVLSIYGSPWSPEFYDWAFNVSRGAPSAEIWSGIPTQTDVLVTHGPPLGRGDECEHGGRAGCTDLLEEVQERVKPRLHVFGHIHEGYGTTYDGTTLYANASNLDLDYDNVPPCTVIDLPHDPAQSARVVVPHCDLTGDELVPWFRRKGYTFLADVLERQVKAKDLLSGNELLDTPNAYRAIKSVCLFSTPKELKAKVELRKALLQLHAESF